MIRIKKIICLLIAAFMLACPVLAVSVADFDPDEESDEAPRRFSPTSRVMITDYSIRGGGLVAGEVSEVMFVLKNTGRWATVNSVLLTGWIESIAPVEFTGTNQIFIESIPAGGEVAVIFEYYTKNVDLTALRSVSAGFNISYGDEAVGAERSNSVSVRLPVLRGARTTIDEDDMRWSVPQASRRDQLLYSRLMQAAYAGGFIFCGVWIIIIILFKLGVFKRRF